MATIDSRVTSPRQMVKLLKRHGKSSQKYPKRVSKIREEKGGVIMGEIPMDHFQSFSFIFHIGLKG